MYLVAKKNNYFLNANNSLNRSCFVVVDDDDIREWARIFWGLGSVANTTYMQVRLCCTAWVNVAQPPEAILRNVSACACLKYSCHFFLKLQDEGYAHSL